MEWRPELKNKFHFVDKNSGKVHSTEVVSADPFMFLHISNCYEENGHIVVDLLQFPNGDFFDANFIHKILSDRHQMETEFASFERFVIPLVDDITSVKEGVELVTLDYTTACAYRQGKQVVVRPETFSNKGLELPMVIIYLLNFCVNSGR